MVYFGHLKALNFVLTQCYQNDHFRRSGQRSSEWPEVKLGSIQDVYCSNIPIVLILEWNRNMPTVSRKTVSFVNLNKNRIKSAEQFISIWHDFFFCDKVACKLFNDRFMFYVAVDLGHFVHSILYIPYALLKFWHFSCSLLFF